MKATKLQIPSAKLQRNSKLQIPSAARRRVPVAALNRASSRISALSSSLGGLELEVWAFYGAWSLELGVSQP